MLPVKDDQVLVHDLVPFLAHFLMMPPREVHMQERHKELILIYPKEFLLLATILTQLGL
jgi:hypothetical protein